MLQVDTFLFHLNLFLLIRDQLLFPFILLVLDGADKVGIVECQDRVSLVHHSSFLCNDPVHAAGFAGVDLDGEDGLHDTFDVYIFQKFVACRFSDDQVFCIGTELPATRGGDPDIDEKNNKCDSPGDMPAVAVINGFLCYGLVHVYDL